MKKLFALIITCLAAITSMSAQDDNTLHGDNKIVFTVGSMAVDLNFNKKVDKDEVLYADGDSKTIYLAMMRQEENLYLGIRVSEDGVVQTTFFGDCGGSELKMDETSKDISYYAVGKSGSILFYAIKNKISPEKSLIFVVNPFILKILE